MKIAVAGLGRAGSLLAQRAAASPDIDLACAICRDSSPHAGMSIGEAIGIIDMDYPIVPIRSALQHMDDVDVLVDFSNECFTPDLVRLCGQAHTNLVICTTGHSEDDLRKFDDIASEAGIGIIYAPTLTLGINLLIEFARKISCVLPHFDFAIVERHRRDKPPISETARKIAEATGANPPISSLRAGGYVGVHELTCAGDNECISITHESFSREAFVDGAMAAARYIDGRTGFHTMEDLMEDLESRCMCNGERNGR